MGFWCVWLLRVVVDIDLYCLFVNSVVIVLFDYLYVDFFVCVGCW